MSFALSIEDPKGSRKPKKIFEMFWIEPSNIEHRTSDNGDRAIPYNWVLGLSRGRLIKPISA